MHGSRNAMHGSRNAMHGSRNATGTRGSTLGGSRPSEERPSWNAKWRLSGNGVGENPSPMLRECPCNRVGSAKPAWSARFGQKTWLKPAPRSRGIEASLRNDQAQRVPGGRGRFPLALEQLGISLFPVTRLRQTTPNLPGAHDCDARRTGCRFGAHPGSASPAPAAARGAPSYPKLAPEPADGLLLPARLQADAG